MYASYIKAKFKPGTREDAIKAMQNLQGELSSIPGFRHFSTLDFGDDNGVSVVIYDSKEAWESAAPRAQAILGRMAPFFAEMPTRAGYEVTVDF